MSRLEVFLDEGPGETRGMVVRDGVFEHLLISRDGDGGRHRLGARAAGRVTAVEAGLSGAFVDLGTDLPGFLPLKGGAKAVVGERIEVEVTAEPRGGKGVTLRRLSAAEGEPRLLAEGPSVREQLAVLAPGVRPVEGLAALQAGMDAEEEALSAGRRFESTGLDLAVERTRGLIAVDLDLIPGAKAQRSRANAQGLAAAAQAIRLKRWGGLVVVDLIGGPQDGEAVLKAARAAFPEPGVAFGPVSKLGVVHLSLPWRRTPIEEVLAAPQAKARAAVRALRRALLADTATARVTLTGAPALVEEIRGWVTALGPRAVLKADPGVPAGHYKVEEG